MHGIFYTFFIKSAVLCIRMYAMYICSICETLDQMYRYVLEAHLFAGCYIYMICMRRRWRDAMRFLYIKAHFLDFMYKRDLAAWISIR